MELRDIAAILMAQDPEGLIRTGAPADEYDSEAAQIQDILHKCDNVKDLQGFIMAIFKIQFGKGSRMNMEKALTIANNIYDCII